MFSTLNFEIKVVSYSDINLVPHKILSPENISYCCPPYHPDSTTGILTRESALLLLQLHPLVLWSTNNYCILGHRVLHIASPHLLKNDQIKVWYLPTATEREVRELSNAEQLLNQLAYATTSGGQEIFKTSCKLNEDLVNRVAPLLNSPIEKVADLLSDCSPSTLYKLSTELTKKKLRRSSL